MSKNIREIYFIHFCINLIALLSFVSCSPPKGSSPVVKMFTLNDEMIKILLADSGTISVANINESVYKNTTDYELVGVDAELNRHPDAKGESIMHVKVAFIRYKNTSKIEMHDIIQPMYMLQQQTWDETIEQLKLFK